MNNFNRIALFKTGIPDAPNITITKPLANNGGFIYLSHALPMTEAELASYEGFVIVIRSGGQGTTKAGFDEGFYIDSSDYDENDKTLNISDAGASGNSVRGLAVKGGTIVTDAGQLGEFPAGSRVDCVVSIQHNTQIQEIINGTRATGANAFYIGDGTESDVSCYANNDHAIKPRWYYDDSQKRWKISWGDDAPAAGDLDGVGIPVLTTAERDAITWPANGASIYNTTDGEYQDRAGGSWVTRASGGTFPNASETVAGKVEIATEAERINGTDTGGTGAFNTVRPSQISQAFVQNVTPVTKSNSISEEILYTVSIPANLLAAGKALRVTMNVSETEAVPANITYRVKYGSTIIFENALFGMIDSQEDILKLTMAILAAGSQKAFGTIQAWDNSYVENINGKIIGNSKTSSENETTTLNLTITAQMSVANAGNGITGNYLLVEILR